MAKIAAADSAAMNQLLGEELKTAGVKEAGAAPQFENDHAKYLDLLKDALNESDSAYYKDPLLD